MVYISMSGHSVLNSVSCFPPFRNLYELRNFKIWIPEPSHPHMIEFQSPSATLPIITRAAQADSSSFHSIYLRATSSRMFTHRVGFQYSKFRSTNQVLRPSFSPNQARKKLFPFNNNAARQQSQQGRLLFSVPTERIEHSKMCVARACATFLCGALGERETVKDGL